MNQPEYGELTMTLECSFAFHGAWSGVEPLIDHIYNDLRRLDETAVIAHHHYELHMILRDRRDEIPLAHATLTELAEGSERTRNFPLDRAYRIVHGAVDLVLEWQRIRGNSPLVLRLADLDQAQNLASRFFTELDRRGAEHGVMIEILNDAPPTSIARSAVNAALAAGDRPLNDMSEAERHAAALVVHYRETGDLLGLATISARAMFLYNHFGYYHESAVFGPTVLEHLDALVGDNQKLRWDYIGNIYQGLVTTGRADEAVTLINEQAFARIDQPETLARAHYAIAMLYLRYLDDKDLCLAEQHLDTAIRLIAEHVSDIDPPVAAFLKVFLGNGLAFLRVRQNRPTEAIMLCKEGYDELTAALGDATHRLHRSVLLYNIAQVYQAIGDPVTAFDYYQKAMALDPNYSEYYNEAGNLLQAMGDYERALQLYARAGSLSAPYPQLHFNQGVCMAQLGDWVGAVEQFSRSLDLDPNQPGLLAMRAEASAETGDRDAANRDFSAAIVENPDNAELLAAFAVNQFERGELSAALDLFDNVIMLVGDEPRHFENRAIVREALGLAQEAQEDLRKAAFLRAA